MGVPVHKSKGSYNDVLFVKVQKEKLQPMSQQLIGCLAQEFTKHCAEPDTNQLIAMGCNPLIATLGFAELEAQAYLLEEKAGASFAKFAADFKTQSMQAVNQELHQIFSEAMAQSEAGSPEGTEALHSADDDDDEALASF